MARRLGTLPALDGVRAIAITGVMLLHADSRLAPGGFFGVDIFFVLSAFLITSLILEELGDHRGRFSFKAFYWRRFFRLAPALAVWLVLVAAPTAVLLHQASKIPLATAVSLFYVGDFAVAHGAKMGDAYTHVWSLAIEEQFYAVWPLVVATCLWRARARRQRQWLWVGCGITALAGFGAPHLFRNNYFLPSGHLVCLAIGCLTADLFVRGVPPSVTSFLARGTTGVASLAVLIGAMLLRPPQLGWFQPAVQLAVASATAALILHAGEQHGSLASRLLRGSPSLWLGRRSYGLYLYHRTITLLVPAIFTGITLRYAGPLALVVSLAVAEASWRWVERPINVAGRSWLRKRALPVRVVPEFARPVLVEAHRPAATGAAFSASRDSADA